VNFYHTFYVPNNAVLSIAGDIDIEETKELVAKYFGSIPKGEHEIPRPTVVEPPLTGEIRDTVYDNIQLPAVIQTYRIPEDPGVSINFAIANMGVDPKVLEEAMDEEIRKVQEELISEKEFQKLRNQVESDFVSQNSSVVGIAENLANYYLYYGDANLINTELNRYLAVTREDIRHAARKYYTLDKRVVLYYLPKPQEEQ